MLPALAVGYNSHAGNGLLGMGWNLGGLSAISRAGKDIYHDGEVSPVENADNQDFYTLDGNRLVLSSGTYGSSSSVYVTEEESFARITLNGSGANTWFKVEAKDGKTLEYGNTDLSKQYATGNSSVVYWQLNKITDTYGNYVEFKYANLDGQKVLDEINYTGNTNAGLAPYNKVKFTYATRKDPSTVYIAGTPLKSKYLLTNIKSTNEGTTVSEYTFTYGYNGLYSFLNQIDQYGSDGTQINPTIFKYGEESGFTATVTGLIDGDNYDVFPGDFDGDGFTDIMRADRVPNQTYHNKLSYFKNNNGVFSATPTSTLTLNNLSTVTMGGGRNSIFNKYADYLVSDANGDGKADIVIIDAGALNTLVNIKIYSVDDNANISKIYQYDAPTDIKYWDGSQIALNSVPYFFPGDFDGDGKMDFITILKNNKGVYTTSIVFPSLNIVNSRSSVYSLNVASPYTTAPNQWQTANSIRVLDFDGDGKQDVMVIKGSTIEIFTIDKLSRNDIRSARRIHISSYTGTYSDIYLGDFNGDRKSDMLRLSPTPNLSAIWYSTGKDFTIQPFNFQGNGTAPKIQIGDFNGDGASDILSSYDTQVKDPKSPDKFVYSTTKIDVYYFSGDTYKIEQYTDNKQPNSLELLLGDFNGDGRTDGLPRYDAKTISSNIWTFKPKGKERLLHKVTNGYNHTTEFNYNLLTEGGTIYSGVVTNTTAPSGSPRTPIDTKPPTVRIARFPLQVVSSVTTPAASGDATNFVTNYSYEDATVHAAGRGFLGFAKITESNPNGGFKSATELEFSAPFYVPMVKKQISIANGSTVVAQTTNLNTIVDLGNKRFWKRTDESTSYNALKGNKTYAKSTYDSYGNLLSATVNTNNGLEITTTTNSSFCKCGAWIPSKPEMTATTNTRRGANAVTKTMTATYHATTGALLTATNFAGQSESSTTTYSNFTAFGQAQNVSISSKTSVATGTNVAQANITRTSSVAYDTKGRFAIKATNALGQSNSSNTTYDTKWGKPLSETTINGLTTTYEYDGYGRTKKVNMPEGYSVATAYVWDVKTGDGSNTSNVDNSIYYTHIQHPGRPDVKTWYDLLGRTRKSTKEGFKNTEIFAVNTYDGLGRLKTKTLPFYQGDVVPITKIFYNIYGLPEAEANSIGSTTYNYDYNPADLVNITTGTMITTRVTTPSGQTSSAITDGAGKTIKTQDNKSIVTEMSYDSWGNAISTTAAGASVISMTYDDYGRQTNLIDKNAGTTTYLYNSFGELVKQVSPKGTHTMEYDVLGRVKQRTGTEGTTIYEYVASGNGINQVKTVKGFAGETKTFDYDKFSRVLTETDVIDGITFTNTYAYDAYSNLLTVKYPSQLQIDRDYDTNGYLKTIKNGATTIFENTAKNALGQYTAYKLGGNQTVANTYNQYGVPTNFKAGTNSTAFDNIQNLTFDFDLKTGNLTSRTDTRKKKWEYFTYDEINRLKTAQVGTAGQAVNGQLQSFVFADNGNITSKTDVGNYVYDASRIHAIASVTNPSGMVSSLGQTITYAAYQQPMTIAENGNTLTYTYAADYQRIKGILTQNGTEKNKRYYFGDFERDITAGTTRDIHYIGADGLNCILEKVGTTTNFYYIYKDYLGSLLTVTNATGAVVTEQNFDAWGRNRNTTDWTYSNIATPPTSLTWLTRGYTGHEHLPTFSLINMNGRLYDPLLGRMLSSDNYTHGGSQGYNRYTYAMNNPLKYTDPTGQWIHIAVGALIGGAINGYAHSQEGLIGFAKGFVIGAAAGALTAATGGAAAVAFAGGSGAALFSSAAVAAATANVIGGAIAGGVGSGVGSLVQGLGNSIAFKEPYTIKKWAIETATGAVVGGAMGGIRALLNGTNIYTGKPVAEGRTILSWENTAKYTAKNLNYNVEVDGLQRVIDPNTISRTLEDFGVSARSGNPIYKETVDKYLEQMTQGSFDISKSGGGWIIDSGQRVLINDGHHRVIAATIYGMRTGNYDILGSIVNGKGFQSAFNNSGYNLFNFGRFPITWH
jgi:RHS repeat-associated protein